jgi:hypothetical protein
MLYLAFFLVSIDVCAILMVGLQLTGLSPARILKQVSLQFEDVWALLFKCILPGEFGSTSRRRLVIHLVVNFLISACEFVIT